MLAAKSGDEAEPASDKQRNESENSTGRTAKREFLGKRERIAVRQTSDQKHCSDKMDLPFRLTAQFQEPHHQEDHRYVFGKVRMSSNPTKHQRIAAVTEAGIAGADTPEHDA